MIQILKRVIHKLKSFIPLRFRNGNQFESSISIPSNVQISKCKLSSKTTIQEGVKLYGIETEGDIFIGDYSSLWGPNIVLHAGDGKIQIGKYCSIAQGVSFYNFNHRINHPSTYFINKNILNKNQSFDIISKGNISIGHDVWIGVNSVILSGINIGNGAIIAAGSVITKDIPPYAIAAGNPAKIIKYRFNEGIINKLQEINWWNWPIEKIKLSQTFFNTEIINLSFIDKIK